jgi:hypothetical protein
VQLFGAGESNERPSLADTGQATQGETEMKLSEMFPSPYLKADDVGSSMVLTIRSVECEALNGEEKYVLYFRETKKGLVLNKTNATIIAGMFGEETDTWIGREIKLRMELVSFAGKRVSSIRVANMALDRGKQETFKAGDEMGF